MEYPISWANVKEGIESAAPVVVDGLFLNSGTSITHDEFLAFRAAVETNNCVIKRGDSHSVVLHYYFCDDADSHIGYRSYYGLFEVSISALDSSGKHAINVQEYYNS